MNNDKRSKKFSSFDGIVFSTNPDQQISFVEEELLETIKPLAHIGMHKVSELVNKNYLLLPSMLVFTIMAG